MTALFMLFADAAMASANPPGQAGDIVVTAPAQRGTPWSPNVADWDDDTPTCPYFFDEEIKGFGKVRAGGLCIETGAKLADPWRG